MSGVQFLLRAVPALHRAFQGKGFLATKEYFGRARMAVALKALRVRDATWIVSSEVVMLRALRPGIEPGSSA